MQSTYDRLMDRLADSDEDCRKLEEQRGHLQNENKLLRHANKGLEALILEQDKEWNELNAEVRRLQAIIDDDNKIC